LHFQYNSFFGSYQWVDGANQSHDKTLIEQVKSLQGKIPEMDFMGNRLRESGQVDICLLMLSFPNLSQPFPTAT
jgi:hypothetical protein